MGALRRDTSTGSHQEEEDDWKITFNCFAIFYYVKPMHQEQGLSENTQVLCSGHSLD